MYVYNYNNFVKILIILILLKKKCYGIKYWVGIKNSKIVLMRLLILIKSC